MLIAYPIGNSFAGLYVESFEGAYIRGKVGITRI